MHVPTGALSRALLRVSHRVPLRTTALPPLTSSTPKRSTRSIISPLDKELLTNPAVAISPGKVTHLDRERRARKHGGAHGGGAALNHALHFDVCFDERSSDGAKCDVAAALPALFRASRVDESASIWRGGQIVFDPPTGSAQLPPRIRHHPDNLNDYVWREASLLDANRRL